MEGRKKSLAVSVACMAIYRPTPGLKGRTFKLCVLTRWDFNFCIRSSPLREMTTKTVTRTINNKNGMNNKEQEQRQLNSNSKNSKTRTTTVSITTELQHAPEEEEEGERQQTNHELSLSDYSRPKRYDREPARAFRRLLHS